MPKLVNKENCVGCSACASICRKQCIEMKKDSEGFVYPIFTHPENCVECGMCENVCPVLEQNIEESDMLPSAYAAVAKDESIRLNSSSGGIFTEISKKVIVQNGVVYGAAYNQSFAVVHECVKNIDDLQKLRGAKYAESDLGSTYLEILSRLKNDQIVLFSGTPCQVSGLKSFLKRDYENLICVDFVCHGVPSSMAWKEYVKYRAKIDANGDMPIKINLRDKTSGWSKYKYFNVFQYQDGTEHSCVSSDSLYMKLFVGDYISRKSCSDCKFKGYSRVSDITLGDFWGIWDIAPEMDDNKGTSLVLIQSEKGRKLFESISERIEFKVMTLEQASLQNPSILKSSPENPKRQHVLDMIREGRIDELENMFRVVSKEKNSIIRKIVRKLKNVFGYNV